MNNPLICPDCEEDIELCGECGDIIHDHQTKAYGYDGADVLCETCYRKRRGQCQRKRLVTSRVNLSIQLDNFKAEEGDN